MKIKLNIAVLGFIIIATACKKSNFTTKPTIKIKSISPTTVNTGDIIRLEASYTDKEGDIGDSVIIVYKLYEGTSIFNIDSSKYLIKDFGIPPGSREGDLKIEFLYNQIISGYVPIPGVDKDRDASFGIILKDLAGNKSDYVETQKILIKK
ncbi:MAG TPA: hypothetical protein VFN30_08525 [Chitinophagaceae bacterium]|nr:hypothetical protein [Chitinophagaceae bacterium]